MNGYEFVADKVREYWKKNGSLDVVCFISLDGGYEEVVAFNESDSNYEDVTFNFDFWEGEKDIQIQKIVPLWEVLYDWRKANLDEEATHDSI